MQLNEVHTAISRAAAATGVDFNYLLAQAKLESGLDPNARAGTSSAAGLFQFISGTWLETLDRHGAKHGLDWADTAISSRGGRASVNDAGTRSQIMAMRYDPGTASLMAAELARDNGNELRGFLGREPEPTELYLAHFLGVGGARSFLGALHNSPGQSAADLFPGPANANRSIFYDDGRARSVGEVMDLMRAKVSGAMNGTGGILPTGQGGTGGFGNLGGYMAMSPAMPQRNGFAAPAEAAQRSSMADTLRSTFGGSGSLPGSAAGRVDAAYAKFRAFGL
ncbi:transglycosylase SLT domain-containing protein [Altererythrobacter xixiisoli]|uniref:Transglycosylase SLT domain-containing protein n=1 Tax=Croceibacterium xixiisoli TaxID=1476466 RepID=A0A6I4TRI2_9SPHN|nr:transglycosylase SLT domain-containing protein [Croceibacterium xixiisoli]